MTRSQLITSFEANVDRFVREWEALLRFPSISVDPRHRDDCRHCAEWIAKHLQSLGFAAELWETAGHPLVFAEGPRQPGRPTVLVYGHYDVQPPDPLDHWISPPFQPQLRDGRLYARGAQDNKGQCFYVLKALETLMQHQALAWNVKILIEGDEESGHTREVIRVLETRRDRIRADVVMACDTGTVPSGAPTITMGLRGIVHLTVRLSGSPHDLHSGFHGGRVPNPAMEMARLLATLHTPEGRIAIPGYYDTVTMPDPRERALANASPYDDETFRRLVGVDPVGGEPEFTPVERVGFRPTLDLNGIHSGYGGTGSKTIIPSSAEAKLSARLVAGQEPERALDAIVGHLQAHAPRGLSLTIPEKGVGGPAIRLSLDSPVIRRARQVLDHIGTLPTAFVWDGASVPILAILPALAGGEALLVGFGSETDHIHAPNESFSLAQFRDGYLYAGLFLGAPLTDPAARGASA